MRSDTRHGLRRANGRGPFGMLSSLATPDLE